MTKQNIILFFTKIITIKSIWFWIFTSSIIQTIWLFLKIENNDISLSTPYQLKGDGIEYTKLIMNLIQDGTYSDKHGNYANRMPGIALLLYPLLLLLPFKSALTLFVIIQTFFLSVSSVLLSKIGTYFSKDRLTFIFIFILSNISTHFNATSTILYSECLDIFSLIAMLFLFIKGLDKRKIKILFVLA